MTNSAQKLANLFLQPEHPRLKQYEALRARFVDEKPWADIAEHYGLHPRTLRNLASEVRKSGTIALFQRPATQARSERDQRILALRKQEHLSNTEIQERLASKSARLRLDWYSRTRASENCRAARVVPPPRS